MTSMAHYATESADNNGLEILGGTDHMGYQYDSCRKEPGDNKLHSDEVADGFKIVTCYPSGLQQMSKLLKHHL